MKWIEKLVTTKSWWDTVDFLASNAAGPWFRKFPEKKSEITSRWNASENFWLQRMSILFQLKYKAETDTKILRSYILPLMESKEFFIRKAIGWALREYAKTDPKFVSKLVKELPLSPLSKKEAMKGIERIRKREEAL
jgi:3-methyladenine DNA glycosylase AlkD